MKVLVAFASERGGTEGLADMVGSDLRFLGHSVTDVAAHAVTSVDEYDAVIVGAPIYFGRWHAEALDFIDRFAEPLRQRPVWLFASGPLNDDAVKGPIKPISHVKQAMKKVNARGQITFGGRLSPAQCDTFMATRMVKKHSGDFRDFTAVSVWVNEVNKELWTLRISDAASYSTAPDLAPPDAVDEFVEESFDARIDVVEPALAV
jgi:menaquinone-dependent protoporphyrinogen oxidase